MKRIKIGKAASERKSYKNKVMLELEALAHHEVNIELRPLGWEKVPMDKLGFLVVPAEKSNMHVATVFYLLKDIWALEWRLLDPKSRPTFEAYIQIRLSEYEQYINQLINT